ncbi:MAG: hypothetical protein NZ518_02035, partial [Dehalococcoidia bacterium]|nr:hypothetical protein [Dehalococcoidia bacterium]
MPAAVRRALLWRLALAIIVAVPILRPSAPPAPTMAAEPVSFSASPDGRLLGPDGRPFFIIGVNYEGPFDRAWKMWENDKFDLARIKEDLARAKTAGVNTLRVFIQRPLPEEIAAGDFRKLDAFLALAEQHQLALIITLADYGEQDLAKISETARRIAERYRRRAIILAYDLKNEPKWGDLTLASYPSGGVAALLRDQGLIARYGERVKREDVPAWRQGDGRYLAPARMTDDQAYYAANHYAYYRDFLSAAATWVAKHEGSSTMTFLAAPEAAQWQPLLNALSENLRQWLAPQIAAIRSADPTRLVTVGYNDPVLARLPANDALSLLSIHRYPGTSLRSLKANLGTMETLRSAFPTKPVALTEFGWSNATVDPNDSALLEIATFLAIWTQGYAGAMKWMLTDLPPVGSPKEDNFGMFRTDGSPKPIVPALAAFAAHVRQTAKPGALTLEAEGDGLRYRYQTPTALFVGGRAIGDPRLGVTSAVTTQVFAHWADTLRFTVTAKADVDLNAQALTGRPLDASATLHRGATPVAARRDGQRLIVTAEAGAEYRLVVPVTALDARLQIVWPHGNLPVTQATKVNIQTYLFGHGATAIACPEEPTPIRLWRSINNGVEEPVGALERHMVTVNGLTFPAWSINDVDVSAARDPQNKVYFRVSADGVPTYGTVWSHGADARTHFPKPDTPTSVDGSGNQVDAKIQIVWPHGNLPVARATKANIGVYVFQRGTLRSMPIDFAPTVRLWRAVGNEPLQPIATGVRVTQRVGDLVFPVWTFNDVDVSAATNPATRIVFRASVDGMDSRSNIWSHAADARTIMPQRDTPTGVLNCR